MALFQAIKKVYTLILSNFFNLVTTIEATKFFFFSFSERRSRAVYSTTWRNWRYIPSVLNGLGAYTFVSLPTLLSNGSLRVMWYDELWVGESILQLFHFSPEARDWRGKHCIVTVLEKHHRYIFPEKFAKVNKIYHSHWRHEVAFQRTAVWTEVCHATVEKICNKLQ